VTSLDVSKLLAIASRSEVTGVPWRSLLQFYELPAELRGIRALDVCSGMSDFAYRLRENGADAHALDIAYHDLAAMRSRHRANFDATSEDVFGAKRDSPQAQALYGSFVQGFEDSLVVAPSIYIAASATALPLRNNSMDLVTSFNGLFGALDFDVEILVAALSEVIRVVRPGGSIQLVPFQEGPVLSDSEKEIQRKAVQAIAGRDEVSLNQAVARYEPLLGGRVSRLTIRKLSS